ncbi:Fic/DOC family protein [uncultured archaeon]|nr:Fic/DOC family protein [uncultured archaeon]
MTRKPYRIEIDYPKNRSPQYNLVKEVRIGNKHRKIKKYIGSGYTPPSPADVQRLCEEFTYEIELKAAQKKAEMSCALYESDYLTREQIGFLEEIRFVYEAFKELMTTNELEAYEKNFEIKYIQGTTYLEGNTISLPEAADWFLRGIQPKDKSLRELNEHRNFINVVSYRNKYHRKVTMDFIKHLHALIMYNIDDDSAGSFRRSDDIFISGCDFRVCPSELIEQELDNLITNYYSRIDAGHHLFEEAVLFHHKFEQTHPFTNGNGRVGREVFNYMLMRGKYPRLLFLGDGRDIYLKALRFGDNDNYAEMVSIFAKIIQEQRFEVLKENLKKVAAPIKKIGQLRLTDYI